jgi:L,D-transpeptidase catalytic domain
LGRRCPAGADEGAVTGGVFINGLSQTNTPSPQPSPQGEREDDCDEASVVNIASRIDLKPSSIETGALPNEQLPSPPRLAFVAPDGLPLRLTSLVDEVPNAWMTEEHIETPPQPALRITITKPDALPWRTPMPVIAPPPRSLDERLAEISPAATKRLAEKFAAAKAAWPPAAVSIVAIKDKKSLELHARAADGTSTFIHRYPVLAASGKAGPKLNQGDKQVPEGVYGISYLNPNSQYHVALRVNYPNAFDREMAKKDGRKKLGGDIMIHGKALSAGCLAVGDEAAEELFVLAAKVGLPNVKLVVAPTDFRRDGLPAAKPGDPVWLPRLYTEVASAMADTKAPQPSSGLLSFFGN